MSTIKQTLAELHGKNPQKILTHALENYQNIAIAFSGAEDVVLIDMALKIRKDIQIFSLDTGRLPQETYQFIEQVNQHYDIKIELLSPDYRLLEPFIKEKGLFSFYQEGHKECCAIRKVEPLRRKLTQVDAWITGQRKDQNLDTRQDLPEIQVDPVFSTDTNTLIKFNPLINQSSAQIWDYITAYHVPFNALHQQGFISIGCQPCTRTILPTQHERAGRWWWEDATKKECGLHLAKDQT
jgi:phosphoadenosine phosphosulfate reductase